MIGNQYYHGYQYYHDIITIIIIIFSSHPHTPLKCTSISSFLVLGVAHLSSNKSAGHTSDIPVSSGNLKMRIIILLEN